MNNLENAKKTIKEKSFLVIKNTIEGRKENLHINSRHAYQAVEIAATPDWNYPAKGELPDNYKKVLCIDNENNPQIGYHEYTDSDFKFIDNHNSYFYCVAWCELPVFNEKN